MLELIWDCGGCRCGRKNDLLNRVEDVNKKSRVDGGAKVKGVCHGVVGVGDEA